MKLAKPLLDIAVSPVIAKAIEALSRSSVRAMMAQAGAVTALTDSSTGSVGSGITPVNIQETKVAASGSNLAPRAAFNTAAGTINNALSVLMEHLNDKGLAILGADLYGEGNGTIALSGTVAAITKTLTGTDGASNAAMLRSEANAAIVRLRNNLATVIDAFNELAYAMGVTEMIDASKGNASQTKVLGNLVTAGTSVLTANVNTSDLASDAAVDAALTSLADNVAFLASRINALLFHSTSRQQVASKTVVVISRTR